MNIFLKVAAWVAFILVSFFLAMWVGNDVGGYLLSLETDPGSFWWGTFGGLLTVLASALVWLKFQNEEFLMLKFDPGTVFFAAIIASFAFGDVVRPYTTGGWWTPWLFLWVVGLAPLATNSVTLAMGLKK